MKWSQGLCAAILIDGLYPVSLVARLNPRKTQDFPGAAPDPASTPNALAPDWGLAPEAGRSPVPNIANYGLVSGRVPDVTSNS